MIRYFSDNIASGNTPMDISSILNFVQEHMVDVICHVNSEGNFTYISPSCKNCFGYSAGELLGKQFKDFIHPEDSTWLAAMLEKVKRTGITTTRIEFRHLHTGGHYIWIESISKHIFDERGKYEGSFFCRRDITAKKQREDEYIRASKLESVGLLAGGIAHDFNNILTIILGYASMARNCTDTKEAVYTKLVEIEKAARQARGLTKQLLTFAKGGAPVRSVASVRELIEEASMFALTGSNISLKFKFDTNLPPAEVDRDQISQVINNLIINAVQAMPLGGTITVRAENAFISDIAGLPLAKGNYVKISIQDEGDGIPEEIHMNIFDPYFTTKATGTGLGLTTSYSIIKQHDGHITVDSKAGVGTTFNIYLPACSKDTEKRQDLKPGVKTGKGRVLVMDDEKMIRKVAGDMLHLLGYEAEFAADGHEAIALYAKEMESGEPFAAVILDLTIRGSMGGKEAVKKLLELNPQVRAIVSSGYSNDRVLANHCAFGFVGVVAKPYRLEELGEVLSQVISPS